MSHPAPGSAERRRLGRRMLTAVVVVALLGGALVLGDRFGMGRDARADVPPVRAGVRHPNIVFVLTDDLSDNLLRYMPHVRQLARDGVSFRRYFVTDSLCCPSRASIFTGRYPHSTGVYGNIGRIGGWGAYQRNRDDEQTFATQLAAGGYATALMGKYLNAYPVDSDGGPAALDNPPGWSTWDVAGSRGYRQYDYHLDENGRLHWYGHAPADYGTGVLANKAVAFVRHSARTRQAFLLEVAPFSPHRPSVPAPRDVDAFPGLTAPRGPSFNRPNTDAPRWLSARPRLNAAQVDLLDRKFRRRAQSVLAIDRMLGRLRRTLAQTGLAKDTYVVFSSDNGFHLGEHELTAGKRTAFDTDIRVPLVVAGPGVPAGRRVGALAENIDLCPTFEQLAGRRPPATVEGRSLVGLLHGRQAPGWRKVVLVEHHRGPNRRSDPDWQSKSASNPPSYSALRAPNSIYIAYHNGEHEYYDLRLDPFERHNTYRSLPPARRAWFADRLAALSSCHGSGSCWTAAGGSTVPQLQRSATPVSPPT